MQLSSLKELVESIEVMKRSLLNNRVESLEFDLDALVQFISPMKKGWDRSYSHRRSSTIELIDCFGQYLLGKWFSKLIDRLARTNRDPSNSSIAAVVE